MTSLKIKIVYDVEIKLLTGLHIGGLKDDIRIGGIDSPVIRDGFGRPYIPGSSIKGKLRSLVEKADSSYANLLNKLNESDCKDGKTVDGDIEEWIYRKGWIHECDKKNCHICRVFGRAGERKDRGRAIFYDFYPVEYWKENDLLTEVDENILETKPENFIDRVCSQANPRQIERIRAGTVFKGRIVFDVYDEKDKELAKKLKNWLEKLLPADYLGGMGTRGYGRVSVKVTESDPIDVKKIVIENKE